MAWEKRLIFKPPRVFPMLFTREMVYPHVNYWKKGPHHHNNNTGPTFLNLKKGTARVPYKVLGGRWKPTTPFWLDNRSDMTVISPVVAGADWSADLVRFRLIILISRRWSQERESEREREREKKQKPDKNGGVWRGPSFLHEPTTTGWGKNAWKQEGEIENLSQEDRREGHRENQALHEREVSGMDVASWTAICRWAASTGWMLTVR